MDADQMTDSMKAAISETNRRRAKQLSYNEQHHVVPASIHKAIRDLTDQLSAEAKQTAQAVGEVRPQYGAKRGKASRAELQRIIAEMEKRMKEAAKALEFETAAALRDEIYELKALLADEAELKPWERLQLLAGGETPDLPTAEDPA
jgi:excinuclease ABC subunit B